MTALDAHVKLADKNDLVRIAKIGILSPLPINWSLSELQFGPSQTYG